MNDEQRVARAARTWLEDGPLRAPDRAVDAALERITTTTQERDLRVPWRFPQMPMLLRVAAAAIVIAVVAGGALFLVRGPDAPGVADQPTASPSPSLTPTPTASPTPMSVEAYVAARNAICDKAVADTDPLRPRFGSYDVALTDAKRADWVDALDAFRARYEPMIDELASLEPPAPLAAGHTDTVQWMRDQAASIQVVSDDLRAHRDTEARAADLATDPVSQRIFSWENAHVLHHCP